MFSISRSSICLLCILSFSTFLSAQEQRGVDGARLSPVITAATAGEKVVRFGSLAAGVAQIRVQITSATGDPLFDSAWKDGNVFDWPIESLGQPLANGSYRCVVMVKDIDGQVTRKEAVLTAEAGQVSIESRGNEGLTIVGAGGPKITMVAHDEKNGAIVNTSGDLSFRFGEFFAGKDSERMRLTAEGNLGIGTDKPQAPLDVNGLIRTSHGILFPDGTILTTAGGEAASAETGGVNRPTPRVIGGVAPGSQTSGAPRRLTPRPNAPAYQFVVDSAGVHIGTTNAFGLDVAGNVILSSNLALPTTTASAGVASAGVITLGGNRFAHNYGSLNTFFGVNAGNFTMSGCCNTASGISALFSNTAGNFNTAIGRSALLFNNTGFSNTASGAFALQDNTVGDSNAASGANALANNTSGAANTASGFSALVANTTGGGNTAIGRGALGNNTTGIYNTAVGIGAGENLTTGSYNIDIGNNGFAGESGTIRIGSVAQTRFFVAAVRGISPDLANGITVLIDANGQLGTTNSSASVKRDIAGMGEQSSALMKLRPVSFFYRSDTVGFRQYGLIAEEVAEVMPELVQFSPEGEAETVRYHFLAPLLLDQVQKQHRQIEEQQKTIDALTQRLEALERQTVRSQ
jgi:hypothetical protein